MSTSMDSIYEALTRKLIPLTHTLSPMGRGQGEGGGIWRRLQERLNPANYRPDRDPVAESFTVADPGRPPYVVLKHPHALAYLRLNDEEEFLWNQMDGSRNVKDLIIAHFTKFGTLAFGRIGAFVSYLRLRSFLRDKPGDMLGHLLQELSARRPLVMWQRAVSYLLGRVFIIRGIDPVIDRVYRSGGWILYARPMLVLYALIAIVGGVLFFRQVAGGQFNLLEASGSRTKGLGLLFILNYVAIFVHEMAHALTCRHYGAKVNGGGFLLFFGLPAFFIDTTDIWTKSRRARLMTSWAGPYSGLILAGACSLLIAAFPNMPGAVNLHRLAFIWVLVLMFNLIPFVELDGYYMLVDWLDMPRLRPRALSFVMRDLWRKLWRREPFTSLDRLFTWFGIGSVVVTAALVTMGVSFWQRRVGVAWREMWAAGIWGRVGAVVLLLVFLIPLLTSLAIAAYGGARGSIRRLRGWWARPRSATIRERLALLNRVGFFDPLPKDTRLDIARRLTQVRVGADQAVFHQGQPGDAFYLVQQGEADVLRSRDGTEEILRRLGPGDYFGEIALLGHTARTATVRAVGQLRLLALRKGDFERLLAPHLALSDRVDQAIRESDNLRALPLLASLSSSELEALGAQLRRERFPTGAVVVQQGDVGTTFYIIQSGQAEAISETDAGTRRLAVLGAGDYFGEIALLLNVPRSATVRALTPLEVRSLDRKGFEALLSSLLPAITVEAQMRVERGQMTPPVNR